MDDETKEIIIIYLGIPLSFLSLFATSFVICLYLFHKQLQIFPFRLIVYLQISDLIMSFGLFLNMFMKNYRSGDDDFFLCQLQAYLTQYGALSTIIWAMIITTMMGLSLNQSIKTLESYEKTLVFLGFFFPGFISIMLFYFLLIFY